MITFGWPPRELSPNAREHYMRKSRAARNYKADCFYLTKQAGSRVTWDGPVLVSIEFIPPDRRPRDIDNMLASLKSGLDGMAMALGVDDSRFIIKVSKSGEIGGMVKVSVGPSA